MLPCYHGNMKTVERTQTGVRIEKRLLKVTKGLAESLDMSLGELLEGILLHVFEGKAPFGEATLERIGHLRRAYGLELGAADAHRLEEAARAPESGAPESDS